jgi:hypothetical protein
MGYVELNQRDSFWTAGLHAFMWPSLEVLMLRESCEFQCTDGGGPPSYCQRYGDGLSVDGKVPTCILPIITRDDNASPCDAVRAAEELLSREKVDVLSGAFHSHIGLALGDFAKQRKVFFLAGEPLTDKIVWQNGNRYTYRLRASTYMQVAMLVPEAAKLKKKRWAVVYPNYEYGQSAAATSSARSRSSSLPRSFSCSSNSSSAIL